MCTDCREPHLRETFNNIRSSVSQLHRSLPQLNERMASYDQRVANVRANAEQIRREITLNIATLVDELKQRENVLLTEAEARMQSQLRYMKLIIFLTHQVICFSEHFVFNKNQLKLK